jgi:O-methyltransferase involved in polyketide biosynthesis
MTQLQVPSSGNRPAPNSAAKVSSPTAAPTTDSYGIGTTQGQRSAELVAALRAELNPSPEATALCRFSGRMAAGIIMRLVHNRTMLNYIVARPAAFQRVIENNLPRDKQNIIIVEIAAGMSPRGLFMARAMPHAQIIEVDLPGVVKDKQARLKKGEIAIPPNLSWRGADLGVTPLSKVLEGQQVDIITAEGLSQYFPPNDIQRIARYMFECLVPGGIYISDISTEEFRKKAFQESEGAFKFFSRQAGNFSGVVADEDAGRDLLIGAGYQRVDVVRPSVITETMPEVPKPVNDLSAIFCAHKARS